MSTDQITASPESIQETKTYQAINCPIKRKVLCEKTSRRKIEQGVRIATESGFDFWKNLYRPPASISGVVNDLITA